MKDEEKSRKQIKKESNSFHGHKNGTREDNLNPEQSKKELQERYEKLLMVLDSLDAIVYIADIETYEVNYVNKYAIDIFGEVEGKVCWQSFQSNQKGPCGFCTNDKLLTPGGQPTGVYQWEFQNTTNGRWYAIRDRAIKCTNGRMARLEIALDITESKQVKDALEQSEEKYRTLFETMGQGVVYLNAEGYVVSANPAAEQILGFALAQMQGRNFSELRWGTIHEDGSHFDMENHPCMIALKTGKEIKNVVMGLYHTQKQKYRWLNINAVPKFKPEEEGVYQVYTIFEDITEQKKTMEFLHSRSLIDELTGVHNRRGFLTLARQQLKAADRTRDKLFLLFADLDNMKRINDTYGHPAGDRALIEVANILKKTFRSSDIIARVGGDEFVALSVKTPDINSDTVSARLRENLRQHNESKDGGHKLSLSLGTAYYDPEHPILIEELLSLADGLMYEEKKSKKTRGDSPPV